MLLRNEMNSNNNNNNNNYNIFIRNSVYFFSSLLLTFKYFIHSIALKSHKNRLIFFSSNPKRQSWLLFPLFSSDQPQKCCKFQLFKIVIKQIEKPKSSKANLLLKGHWKSSFYEIFNDLFKKKICSFIVKLQYHKECLCQLRSRGLILEKKSCNKRFILYIISIVKRGYVQKDCLIMMIFNMN